MRRGRSGTEPVTARSPLRTRAALSGMVLPPALAATVYFAVKAAGDAAPVWKIEAAIAGLVALIALADLLVIRRRMRAGDDGG